MALQLQPNSSSLQNIYSNININQNNIQYSNQISYFQQFIHYNSTKNQEINITSQAKTKSNKQPNHLSRHHHSILSPITTKILSTTILISWITIHHIQIPNHTTHPINQYNAHHHPNTQNNYLKPSRQ